MRYITIRHTPLRRPLETGESVKSQARRLARQARRQQYRGTLHIEVTDQDGQTLRRYRLRGGGIMDTGTRPVYARPKPTDHGVGLVCIREVPGGTTICSCSNQREFHHISGHAFEKLHPAEQTFYKELFDPKDTTGSYVLPKNPEIMEMACFINHSPTPSCIYDKIHHTIVTARQLQPGDEITVDYSHYLPPHKHNRQYT